MATSCIDSILCENAWDCNITILDIQGNPIDPLTIRTGQSVVFVLGEKPGYIFRGWIDEDDNPVNYELSSLGDNCYQINYVDCSKKYFAKYEAILYTITLTSDSLCFNENTMVLQGTYGSIKTITAEDGYGCRFVCWMKNGEVVTYEHSFDYVVVENATFIAHYDSMWYTITAKPENRDWGTCTGSGTYVLNATVTLAASPNEGYVFGAWDDGVKTPTRTITVNGSKTYIAYFASQDNHIEPGVVPGGSVRGSGYYKTGSVVTMQAIADPGWEFSYMEVDGVRIESDNYSFIASKNCYVIPYFERKTYTFAYFSSPYNGGYINPQPSSQYYYGDTVSFEATPYSGYRFVQWSDGVEMASRTITITSNVELTAIFTEEATQYTVTVSLPDITYSCQMIYNGYNVGVQTGNEVVASGVSGTVLTLTPSIPDGEKIVSVTENGTPIWTPSDETSRNSSIVYTIHDYNTVLTVNYTQTEYQLSVSASPINNTTSSAIALTIDIDGTTETFTPTIQNSVRLIGAIVYGSEITLTAPSTVGDYSFGYWTSPNGSFNTETITFTINSDSVCNAVYYDSTIQTTHEENNE